MFQDYISIPQNNPDLDYSPPPPFSNGGIYPSYVPQPFVYGIDEQSLRIDHPYNSYASSVSTPAATTVSEPYGYQSSKVGSASFF